MFNGRSQIIPEIRCADASMIMEFKQNYLFLFWDSIKHN